MTVSAKPAAFHSFWRICAVIDYVTKYCLAITVTPTARGSDVTQIPDYAVPRRLIQGAIRNAAALIAVSAALKDVLVGLGADGRPASLDRDCPQSERGAHR